jgi:hypothetical protein
LLNDGSDLVVISKEEEPEGSVFQGSEAIFCPFLSLKDEKDLARRFYPRPEDPRVVRHQHHGAGVQIVEAGAILERTPAFSYPKS